MSRYLNILKENYHVKNNIHTSWDLYSWSYIGGKPTISTSSPVGICRNYITRKACENGDILGLYTTYLIACILKSFSLRNLFHDPRTKVTPPAEMFGCKRIDHGRSLSRHPCINLDWPFAEFTGGLQSSSTNDLVHMCQCTLSYATIIQLTSIIRASGCIVGHISFLEIEQVTGLLLTNFS